MSRNSKFTAPRQKQISLIVILFFLFLFVQPQTFVSMPSIVNEALQEHRPKRETWETQRETRCNLLLTDGCSGSSSVCHARPQRVNSQVGDDLPGTATAAAPAEATSVGAPWIDLAWLALLGRCSSPRC